MNLFDTHAHLLDEKFKPDFDDVLKRTNDNMALVMNVGCNLEDCRKTVALAEKHPKIYAAVALHPNDANDYTDELWAEISQLAAHPKVKAVGETGLDYYWHDAAPEAQKILFIKHIDLARQLQKPLVIHDRDAHQDTIDVLKSQNAAQIGGIFHSFSGSWEMAKLLLKMNFYISLSGPVTFKNANKLLEVAENIPLDRLLIETDCPYMTPVPHRGKRNEPMYVGYIAEKIAQLKGISPEEVTQATYENGKRIYGISD